jgi:hypothetical protein
VATPQSRSDGERPAGSANADPMARVLDGYREQRERGEDVPLWARFMLGCDDQADDRDDEIPEGPGEIEALQASLEASGVRMVFEEEGPDLHPGGADLNAAARRFDRRIETRERRRRVRLRPRRLIVRRRGGCAGRPRARVRRHSAAGASRAGPDGSLGDSDDGEPAPGGRLQAAHAVGSGR